MKVDSYTAWCLRVSERIAESPYFSYVAILVVSVAAASTWAFFQ